MPLNNSLNIISLLDLHGDVNKRPEECSEMGPAGETLIMVLST